MRETIAAHQKILEPGDATVVLLLCNLARVLQFRGNQLAMSEVVEQILALNLGENAEDIRAVQPFKKLGIALKNGGETEFAERLWIELLEAQRRLLPDDSLERAETDRLLSELHG